jgi:hypothetical protein
VQAAAAWRVTVLKLSHERETGRSTKGNGAAPTSVPPTRKLLPTTQLGRPMQLPLGTGMGISGLTSGERYLMSGGDAQKAENIIALFEAINGRKAA